ncbi:polyprenol monophosphomannose synthase [Chlamydiota bacterium]
MKPLIIIPTYNEKDNIKTVVAEIKKYTPQSSILIVDDNSPDGTGMIANGIAATDDAISVLHRERKAGLGRAYTDAVKHVFNQVNQPDIICWMDSDLSHNPCYLPDMFTLLRQCDIVIGSRYIKGGGVLNWPLQRKFLSWGGNLYARTISGLHIKDCTSGFVAFRASVLKELDLSHFRAHGYSFLIETKSLCQKKRFRLQEYPIIFEERREGSSKLSWNIIFEALWVVWKMRFSFL